MEFVCYRLVFEIRAIASSLFCPPLILLHFLILLLILGLRPPACMFAVPPPNPETPTRCMGAGGVKWKVRGEAKWVIEPQLKAGRKGLDGVVVWTARDLGLAPSHPLSFLAC